MAQVLQAGDRLVELRRLPQRYVLVGAIAGWALSLGATAALWTSAAATLTLGAAALAILILARGAGGRDDRRPADGQPPSRTVSYHAPGS